MPSAQLKSNLKAESTIFDPAQHYISFSAVVDSSAPNGAPTFDGRRTLNGNEIAAMQWGPLFLPQRLLPISDLPVNEEEANDIKIT